MEKTSVIDTHILYLPENLKSKLPEIPKFPTTIIEAPSGFGKTTALDMYFGGEEFLTVPVHKAIFLNQSVTEIWRKLCDIIGKIDANCQKTLKSISVIDESTIGIIEEALQNMEICEETYIILDNFDDIKDAQIGMLINVLLRHEIYNLHIVISVLSLPDISRMELLQNRKINILTETDFAFTSDDIYSYYLKAGISLSDTELDELYKMTGGWVFALYIQLLSYAENREFAVGKLDDLIEHAFWNRLTDDEKSFYASLSALDEFTVANAVFVSEKSPEYVNGALKNNGFIHFDYQTRQFYFHSILLNFLRKMFDVFSEEYKQKIYLRAGEWAEKNGNRLETLVFYNKAKAYEQIFVTALSSYDIADIADENSRSIIIDLLENTSDDIKIKYPFALVNISFALFFLGETERLVKTLPHIHEIINRSTLSNEQRNAIYGELELLVSFLKYNKIDEMSEHHRKALALLEGRASLISMKSTWTFGSPSVLYMFYRESGKLQEELLQMDECMPIYYKLTGGHGNGAEIIMRAESFFMQNKLDEAEALCHHALFAADSKNQNSIYQCGLFLLARIAQLKGDDTALKEIIHMIYERSKQNTEDLCRYTLDLSLGFLNATLKNTENVADWLKKGEKFEKMLTVMTVPFAYIIYGKLLLQTKEYNKLLGVCTHAIGMSKIFSNLLPEIYMLIYKAAAEYDMGMIDEANETLYTALTSALPDKVYMPFGENFEAIKGILQNLKKTKFSDDAKLDEIFKLGKKFAVSANALCENKLSLSQREREVASLVKKGYTNKQISEKLFISVATVKKTLEHIFEKSGIVSRTQIQGLKW